MAVEDFGMVYLITGKPVDEDSVIAKCHNGLHRGNLDKKLVKSHQCIEKECMFFEKTNMEYWHAIDSQRMGIKTRRIQGLQKKKEKALTLAMRNQCITDLLELQDSSVKVISITDLESVVKIVYSSVGTITFTSCMEDLYGIVRKGVYFKRLY